MAGSSNISALSLTMDMSFDLDEALTLPEIPRAGRDVDSLATVEAVGDECSVCMEGFGPGRLGKRLTCCHVYHRSCIADWSLRHNSCPLCRSKIFQEN